MKICMLYTHSLQPLYAKYVFNADSTPPMQTLCVTYRLANSMQTLGGTELGIERSF